MLKLWLARHGQAVDPDVACADFDRQLTETGRHQLRETARWLIAREAPPELILHSPLVRARQTAETILAELGEGSAEIRVENALSPGIDVNELLNRISETMVESVLCVGHQPDMSHCVAEMIGGGSIQYLPGTIAAVEFTSSIARHCGRLCWVTTPQWFG